MKRLTLKNVGQVKEADLHFGDLTVLVGPQASGKSISLQWLKLLADTGLIQRQMKTYGLDYDGSLKQFLDVYFGEGMQSIWKEHSAIQLDGKALNTEWRIGRLQPEKPESAFFIPAQRVIALTSGWPRPFQGYSVGDPYTVRAFSEGLRLLMEREFTGSGPLFPKSNRLKSDYRKLLQQSVFANFSLSVDKVQAQKRLVLQADEKPLPYMVWSAGQREFVPLLLGLYWLMPPAKVARRGGIEWVVIEELEMGLHPRAISVVLLLVLELMSRGYKVCLSTHSPQVLELVWALEVLRKHKGSADDLLNLFDAPHSAGLREMARAALGKTSKVYYFDPAGTAKDITDLDPSSAEAQEASWGGLLEFSARANETVAKAVANSPEFASGDLFVESK
ncbi:AAA family ATPase [Accumulibacter sp.]|uniref:AAA family ATPase n=1 Tax=Accumulibacter sp. TaxID=2053492 RepID=UPI0025F651CD|nr:AAA family ATPase [Accumulibacter sp.]MCM8614226.1 ATP-binding protein [Accumulibacter sp.]MCM8638005.1 ATP-binding protein [Accumulibacter sp.]MCM8641351.1 ATP-binding protein [Accumulibacter sp.]